MKKSFLANLTYLLSFFFSRLFLLLLFINYDEQPEIGKFIWNISMNVSCFQFCHFEIFLEMFVCEKMWIKKIVEEKTCILYQTNILKCEPSIREKLCIIIFTYFQYYNPNKIQKTTNKFLLFFQYANLFRFRFSDHLLHYDDGDNNNHYCFAYNWSS